MLSTSSSRWVVESLLVFVAGLCLTTAWKAVTGSMGWLLALYAAVGMAAWVAWRRIRWPDGLARFASLGAVFLLMTVLNRLLFSLDYVVFGHRFDAWPVPAIAPEWALMKGEVATLLGTLLTVAIWLLCGGLQVSPAIVLRQAQRARPLLATLLTLGFVTLGVSRASTAAAASLGQLLPTVFALALVAVALLPLLYFRQPHAQLLTVIALSLPFIADSLSTGMKENLFLAFLPTALVAWRGFHGTTSRVLLLAGGVLLIGLVSAYVGYYREEVWHSNSGRATTSVLNDFSRQAGDTGTLSLAQDGVMSFLERNNASYHRGLAVWIADEEQTYPDLVFGPLVYVFVPRAAWSDKPEIKQGWEYSGVVFGQDYLGLSSSSTAAGLYTSFYLGAGWFGAFGGAMVLGLSLAWSMRICSRFGGPLVAGLYSFAMLPAMLRFDETWSVGALCGPPIAAVYTLIVVWTARGMSSLFIRSAQPTRNANGH